MKKAGRDGLLRKILLFLEWIADGATAAFVSQRAVTRQYQMASLRMASVAGRLPSNGLMPIVIPLFYDSYKGLIDLFSSEFLIPDR